jgi:hypothetical protein
MIPLFQKIKVEGPKMTKQFADNLNKIKAKTIVQSIADVKVAKLIRIFYHPSDFCEDDINPNYILKASRWSGFCIDLSGANVSSVCEKLHEWKRILEQNELPVEFLIEEKLNDAIYGITGTAVDYKFFCFHGKPAFFLCRDGKNRNFYDLEYNPLKLASTSELPHIDLAPMISMAEKLSAPFPFVRIDLYNCKDGIYFGEYTFNCREGRQEFTMDLELRFGQLW